MHANILSLTVPKTLSVYAVHMYIHELMHVQLQPICLTQQITDLHGLKGLVTIDME